MVALLVTHEQAAQIQAGAAAVVAVLTVVLSVATIVYVKKTGDLVRVSQNQLNELKEARSASFRPLLHGLSVLNQQAAGSPLQARLRAQNVGRGPIVDLELNDRDWFDCEPNLSTWVAGEVFDLFLTAKNAEVDRHFDLPFKYHDLENVVWLTTLGVDLDRPGGAARAITRQVTTRQADL